MLASVSRCAILMFAIIRFVSKKSITHEYNFNLRVSSLSIQKGAKTVSFGSFGTPGQIRTADLSLRRRTLLSS